MADEALERKNVCLPFAQILFDLVVPRPFEPKTQLFHLSHEQSDQARRDENQHK
jgi:hypothetical protein